MQERQQRLVTSVAANGGAGVQLFTPGPAAQDSAAGGSSDGPGESETVRLARQAKLEVERIKVLKARVASMDAARTALANGAGGAGGGRAAEPEIERS